MAITVQSTPPLVALSGNRIPFRLSTNNHIQASGTAIVAIITFASKGVAGDTITISWGSVEIVFTCADSPDNSGLQLPTSPAAVNDWVTATAAAMALNYQVDQDFVVTSSTNTIILTARETGSGYSIEMEKTWTGTDPVLSQSGGVNEVARTFFKLGLQVLIKSGSTFSKIAEDLLPVDADAEALFDIRRTFADQLESEFAFPEASDTLIIHRANQCREYRVRYYEQFGSDITPQKLAESASFFVLHAGISQLQQAIYNRQDSSYWAKLSYNQFFLTWQPLTKYIDRYQPEKLYFLVRDTTLIGALKLKAIIYKTDGEVSAETLLASVSSPPDKAVYEIICTLNVLELDGYDDGTIEKYDIWIDNHADERVSEIRTFVVDQETHEDVRYFLFRNSLGGFDTLRTTGIGLDGVEHQRTDISKVLGQDFTEMDHQVAAGSVTEVKTFTVNTGWKTLEDVEWIRDFLLSKQVYQVTGRKLVPIVITTNKAGLNRDREDLYSIEFSYRRAYQNEHYSKQIPYAEFDDDYNNDFAQAR